LRWAFKSANNGHSSVQKSTASQRIFYRRAMQSLLVSRSSSCMMGPQVEVRRRVGRPVMHGGDPNDQRLTEKERRRIRRRIANRESAQRVRYRRREEMEEMQIRVSILDDAGGVNSVGMAWAGGSTYSAAQSPCFPYTAQTRHSLAC